MKLTSAGVPLTVDAAGYVESFAYGDGPLTVRNAKWADAFDLYPDSYDQATIADGLLNATGYTVNTWPTLVAHPNLLGHVLAVIDLEDIPSMAGHTDDDYSVSVSWDTTDPFAVTSQVSPCGFVDLAAASYREVGVKPVWDVSVTACYMQNVFRAQSIATQNDYKTIAEGDADDWDYYDYLSSNTAYSFTAGPSNARQTMTFRARNGQCRGYWNGTAITPVISTPAWAVGRTKVGLDVIHIHFEVGQTVGSLGAVDHVVEDLITSFTVTPFTGTL